MARTIDFRTGTHMWGHALHSGTWRYLPPRRVGRGWFRKAEFHPVSSFMVHCSPPPQVGDRLLFSSKSGKEVNVAVIKVDPCYDPRDMFTLTVEFDIPTPPSTKGEG